MAHSSIRHYNRQHRLVPRLAYPSEVIRDTNDRKRQALRSTRLDLET
jgi:hypothetical protein